MSETILVLGGSRSGKSGLAARLAGEAPPVTSLGAVSRAAGAARGGARVIWVWNEVGSGIVPANPLARGFADLQGVANQRLAAACDVVRFGVAGLSLGLK